MTKPLSKTEKAHRATVRRMQRDAEIDPKKIVAPKPKKKPAAKAKKAAPKKVSKGELEDEDHLCDYIEREGPQSLDELMRAGLYESREIAEKIIDSALEVQWIVKTRGRYQLALAKMPQWERAAREKSDAALRDLEIVVDYIFVNCPDDSTPVTTEQLANGTELSRSVARRACMNGVKLGRLVRDADGYRLVKGHKGAKKAKKKLGRKARAQKVRDSRTDLDGLEGNEAQRAAAEHILHVLVSIGPATQSELEEACHPPVRYDIPAVAHALGRMGWISNTVHAGYWVLSSETPLSEWATRNEILQAPSLVQRLQKEAVAHKQRTEKVEKEQIAYDNARFEREQRRSQRFSDTVDALRKQIKGWQLRSDVQIASYRLEHWEAGLLTEEIRDVATSLDAWRREAIGTFDALQIGPDRKEDATAGELRAWVRVQLQTIGIILENAQRHSQPRAGVMGGERDGPVSEQGMVASSMVASNGVEWGMSPVPSGADLIAMISAQPRERGGKS